MIARMAVTRGTVLDSVTWMSLPALMGSVSTLTGFVTGIMTVVMEVMRTFVAQSLQRVLPPLLLFVAKDTDSSAMMEIALLLIVGVMEDLIVQTRVMRKDVLGHVRDLSSTVTMEDVSRWNIDVTAITIVETALMRKDAVEFMDNPLMTQILMRTSS